MINWQKCDCGMRLGLHVMADGRSHTCKKCKRVWMMQNDVPICIVSRQNPFDALGDSLKKTGGPVVHPEHYNACGNKSDDGSVKYEIHPQSAL